MKLKEIMKELDRLDKKYPEVLFIAAPKDITFKEFIKRVRLRIIK